MATLTTLLVDGNGTSPRAWTSQASTDIDEGIGSADGSYAYHAPVKDTSVDTSFTLTDVDTDLGNVDTLTYTVRTQQSGRADDTLHLDGRIVNGGTILAAADSGGTFQRLDADIQHTAWTNTGPTAWTYVNTTADKATWNGATLELRAVNVGLKGGDLAEIRVDTIDLDGTYTAAAAATDIAGTLTTSSSVAGTPTTIAPGTTAIAGTLTTSSSVAGTPTTTTGGGAASVRGWYEVSDWFALQGSHDVTGVAWEADDVIVAAYGTENNSQGTPSGASSANLTFTERELISAGAENECGVAIYTAVAGSAQTNQTVTLSNDGTAQSGGCVWVLQDATLTGFQSSSNQTEAAITLNPDAGSVVIYFAADWNASTTLGTPETNTGTLTERHDDGDGSSWGALAADWEDVDAGSDGWGLTSYSGLRIGHGAIEVLASGTGGGTTAIAGALDTDCTVAGTPTTIAPGTTAAALALDASADVAGTATAPTPTPTAAALTIDASADVAGTPTAPTTGTTDIAGTLTADVTLAGTATTLAPGTTAAALTLTTDVGIAGTATTIDPGTTAAALTLTASSSIVGVPTAPASGGPTVLFSEDFADISTGADIDEDSNWVIHSYGTSGATAKEASGTGRLTTIGGQNPSTITVEPVYTATDEKSELYFELDPSDGPGFGDYDMLVVGARIDHFDTTATPSDPWDSRFPYRGWFFYCWPDRDAGLYLQRSNSGTLGTQLATAAVLPGWGSTWTPYHFRFQWEKTDPTPYWTLRGRAWGTGDEPATWDIEYEDQSPGNADDPAAGIWAFSLSHHFGTAANQAVDLDNIEVNDMTPVNETPLVGLVAADADVAGTPTAPATYVSLALDAGADVVGILTAPTADATPITGIMSTDVALAGTPTTTDPGTTAAALTLTADAVVASQPVGTVFIVADPSASERLAVDYDSGYGSTADRTPVYSTTADPVYPTMNAAIWEPTGDPVGVILYLVGGGFISNAYQTGVPHWIKRQVGRGFVVCSLQYRTSFILNPNRRPWDDGIENIEDGPGFAATEWPGVPQLVAGHSAGAFYALHLSASADIPAISMSGWADWDHWNHIRANPTLAGDPQPFNPVWMNTSHTTLFEDPPWTDNEEPAAAWPQFTATAPDAAYIIAGDNDGVVHPNLAWSAATMLGAVNIATHVDFIDNVSGTNIDDHEPIAGFNYPALDQWLADQGFAGKTDIAGTLAVDATVAGTATAPAPAATDVALTLTADATVAGAPDAPINQTDIVGALSAGCTLSGTATAPTPPATALAGTLDADAGVVGSPTAPAPGPTAVAGTLAADVSVVGVPTAPTADSTPITGVLDAAVDVAGAPTAPAPAATEAALALTADATLAGAPTAPATGTTDLAGTLEVATDVAGAPTAPAPAPTGVAGTLAAGADVVGVPTAPTADSTPITGIVDTAATLAGAPTAPAPAPTGVAGTLAADATLAGAPTTAGATEIAGTIGAGADVAGAPDTIAPGATDLAGTIDAACTVVGVPAAPTADATPIVGVLGAGCTVAAAGTAPPPTPTAVAAALTVDVAALGAFTATPPAATDLAGAMTVGALVQWTIIPPTDWLPIGPRKVSVMTVPQRTSVLVGSKLE